MVEYMKYIRKNENKNQVLTSKSNLLVLKNKSILTESAA